MEQVFWWNHLQTDFVTRAAIIHGFPGFSEYALLAVSRKFLASTGYRT